MYCTSCGTARADNDTVCPNCGQRIRRPPPLPKIDNHLVPAILSTLCCCLPAGVVAIIFSAQVNSKLAAGDIPAAHAAAKNAKMWCWISVGASAVLLLLSLAGRLLSE